MTNPQQPDRRPNHQLPAQSTPPNQQASTRKTVAIAAGVMTAVVAGGAYGIFKVKDIGDDLTGGSDRSISQPYNPGETTSLTELSREQELGQSEAYLEKERSESIKALRGMGFKVNPEYTEDASNQGLTDSFFVDLYSTWKVGQSNKPKADAILSGIIDPETDDYERYASMIGTGESPVLAHVNKVLDSTNNFYRSDFPGYNGRTLVESNGLAMRVLTNSYTDDPNYTGNGRFGQVVYQQVNAVRPDGSTFKKWTIKQMSSSDDKDFQNDLRPFQSTLK